MKAAGLLKKAVKEDILSKATLPAHVRVEAQVYANVQGLERVYKETNTLPHSASFWDFIRGFNKGDPMFDYVDAGTGKECSDEKVKGEKIVSGRVLVAKRACAFLAFGELMRYTTERFKCHASSVHCQRIYFGGSADNGYARLLEPFLENKEVCNRVCLIEGPPFAQEIDAIKDRFSTVSFNAVLRTQKIPATRRQPSVLAITPPVSPGVSPEGWAPVSPGGWTTIVSRAVSIPTPTPTPTPTATDTSGGEVLRNKSGQRIDSYLQYSIDYYYELQGKTFCNMYHLTGRCPYEDKCRFIHGTRLDKEKREAMRALARHTPCTQGGWCNDPSCIAGHQCKRLNCVLDACKFSRDMHDASRGVVG